MARALLLVEMRGEVEPALVAGDLEAARAIVPECAHHRLPVPSREDTFVLQLRGEMSRPIMAGSQLALLKDRVRWAGLPAEVEPEVLDRVMLVDRIVALSQEPEGQRQLAEIALSLNTGEPS